MAGRVLDITKLKLTQPRLVELGLRLSLAIGKYPINGGTSERDA